MASASDSLNPAFTCVLVFISCSSASTNCCDGFCFDAGSGECLSVPGTQLEQLPLRVDDGVVWVRVGL